MKLTIEDILKKNGFIIDMDGVIYHGNKLLPGIKWYHHHGNDGNIRLPASYSVGRSR